MHCFVLFPVNVSCNWILIIVTCFHYSIRSRVFYFTEVSRLRAHGLLPGFRGCLLWDMHNLVVVIFVHQHDVSEKLWLIFSSLPLLCKRNYILVPERMACFWYPVPFLAMCHVKEDLLQFSRMLIGHLLLSGLSVWWPVPVQLAFYHKTLYDIPIPNVKKKEVRRKMLDSAQIFCLDIHHKNGVCSTCKWHCQYTLCPH